tara:strand:+ start:1471 stop:1767 length:297 start_codon:yes stop_codon:yes gene_type:complete
MELKKFLLKKKLLLLHILLTIYIFTNLIGGERGLVSYLKKKNIEKSLILKELNLENKVKLIEKKNLLLSEKKNLDYFDILMREKLKFGMKEEIIIKLK